MLASGVAMSLPEVPIANSVHLVSFRDSWNWLFEVRKSSRTVPGEQTRVNWYDKLFETSCIVTLGC